MAEGTSVATGIILVAGTMTFANEWYQTKKVNFKVGVATLFAAAVIDGLSHIDEKAATALAVMALLVAATTRFGGKSVSDTLVELFAKEKKQSPKFTATRKAA